MQNRERVKVLIAVAGLLLSCLLPTNLSAQSSSINTFSPYSFYGLGMMSDQGTANIRSMGGAGIAYRDSYLTPYSATINYLNPASYSAAPQKSFLFNFELESENHYLKDAKTKSSYNNFNIRDIAVLFPIAKKLGFGLSVTPYSSVGYRLERIVTDDDIVSNIGHVKYMYDGEGDINQLKAGVGWQVFQNFSIGVEMVYYFGTIDRNYTLDITPITGGGSFSRTTGYRSERVSKIFGNIGVQYAVFNSPKRQLTIGGLYKIGGKLKPEVNDLIPELLATGENLWDENYIDQRLTMPHELSFGVNYQTQKLSIGVDYTLAKWGSKNKYDAGTIKYEDTNGFNIGMQYTPNRFDVRRFLNRLTYRFGLKYKENYFSIKDSPERKGGSLDTKAVTVGLGVPLGLGSRSNLNIGFEYGQMGTTSGRMVKDNYFKVSIGLNFIGEHWFLRHRYQ